MSDENIRKDCAIPTENQIKDFVMVEADKITVEKENENKSNSVQLNEVILENNTEKVDSEARNENNSIITDGPIPLVPIENLEKDDALETTVEAETKTDKSLETVETGETELPKINRRAIPKTSKTYMLETFKKNAMIIFNHEHVDGYEQREGTDLDEQALRRTFKSFGFEVSSFKDKTRKVVGDLIMKFSSKDFTNYGCIAIAILTHGSDMGGLRAKDKKYRERQILDMLKKNPTIATKPIIYIIQACRGNRRQEFNVVLVKKDNVQSTEQYKIPLDADTLILHSTYEGKFSFRDVNSGSWFIQTLCAKINELAETEDFESIMTSVKYEVAIHRENRVLNMKTNVYEYNKQMPVSNSTFIRKLYLVRTEELEEVVEPVLIDPSIELSHDYAEEYVRDPTEPCQICIQYGLERFNYIVNCLEEYYNNNTKDMKAKTLMTIARTLKEDSDAKIEMAKLVRDFFKDKGLEQYKMMYIWNDYENN